MKHTKKVLRNILFLTNGFPLWGRHGAGGIGEYTYNIARELSNCGMNVYVLGCSKDLEGSKKQEFIQGNIHAVVYPYINFSKGAEYLNRIVFLFHVFKLIQVKRIQIIEAPSYLGWLWPIKPWIPLVVKLHSSSTIDQFNKRNKLPRKIKLELRTINMADHVVSVCQYIKNELLLHFPKYRFKNIDVIYNSVNTDLFSPPNIRKKAYQVLFVGNLSEQKGLFDLLEAWKIVVADNMGAKLSLVGPSSKKMHDRILSDFKGQMKDTIELIGSVSNNSLTSFYHQTNLVVVPSHYEANPLVVLEAMSCGCAIVCPDHTGFPEIIRNNYNGILCNTKDPEIFSSEIIRLLKDKNLREKIGRNARKTIIENFNPQLNLQKNLTIYRKLINAH
jgi:glycosyltransferase involved in cell wall biosynthesis